MTLQKECQEHEWENDEMFESGCVTMITNDGHPLGEEMRQVCIFCGKVRYVPK